jgi:hypothetical protein
MYWIDTFGEGFAVWYCGEIIDFCDSQEEAEVLVSSLRAE